MAKVPSKQVKSKSAKSDDGFVPQDVVSKGSALYLKPAKGDTTFRIISKPIVGWVAWEDKRPVRFPIDEEPEPNDEGDKPKKFMTVVVIDRADEKVKILELTQQGIIKAIRALTENPKWGSPFSYDIVVTKTGEDLQTKYTVTPDPKKPLPKDVIKNASAKPCNLDAMFEGTDPWDVDGDATEYFFK